MVASESNATPTNVNHVLLPAHGMKLCSAVSSALIGQNPRTRDLEVTRLPIPD